MQGFITMLPLVMESFLSILCEPVFWIIVLFVALLYRRSIKNSWRLFQIPPQPIWPGVLALTVFGILGGLTGSFLLIVVGVSLSEVAITPLWVTAIFLMLINQRFICFAYAGGLLSLSHLVLGFPELNVSHVMGLVAILHLVESLLIYFSGHLFVTPVYVKSQKGRIVGGYTLMKFWPLPIVALWTVLNAQGQVDLPGWWPLIKPVFYPVAHWHYTLMAVVAALGFSDVALTEGPREKTRRSAGQLAVYSLILLALSVMASHQPPLAVVAALFGPLGHETLIWFGRRRELKGEPFYVPPPRGIMVLEVLWKSPLKKAGVQGGDIILSLNGAHVNHPQEIQGILSEASKPLEIEVLSGQQWKRRKKVLRWESGQALGFIPVPNGDEWRYMEIKSPAGPLGQWLKRFWRKRG